MFRSWWSSFPTGRLSLVELSSSALLVASLSGEVEAPEFAVVGTWPPQLPPGWTVE
uniref:Secreted protein n=1 Tax=Setaria viridis TaxID=4556 RepID=A0A4U6U492_SETVI|nr:hypothetical protein SEVIR_6G121554v2 [Setaria viridis]